MMVNELQDLLDSLDTDENYAKVKQLNRKVIILIDAAFGVALAYVLALVAECPVADSITAGLVLMIALMLIDIQGDQVQ
jgi:thiamine transporter ThiT